MKGQHHSRLAWITGIGLLVAALAVFGAFDARGDLWHRLAGPDVDGRWKFVVIDGVPVHRRDFVIDIRWGETTGGRDDCNEWGYSGDRLPNGDRMITTSLAGCQPDQLRDAYYRLVHGNVAWRLRADDRLEAAAAGHTGLLEPLAD